MRSMIWVWLMVLVLLAACQPSPVSPTTPPQQTVEPYPPPQIVQPTTGEGYPTPPSTQPGPQVSGPQSGAGYPAPGMGEYTMVTWEDAQQLILDGKVAQVTQLHSLAVYLVLKDGQKLQTIEPAIDDVFEVIDRCGEKCNDILLATE